MTRGRCGLAVLGLGLLTTLPLAAGIHSPGLAAWYFSKIRPSQADPTAMEIVVVPPAYVSEDGLATDPLAAVPGTLDRATGAMLEAIAYWEWAIRQHESEFPALRHLAWSTRVVGADATLEDVQQAEIALIADAAAVPVKLVGRWTGYALPTFPPWREVADTGDPMTRCTAVVAGVGENPGDPEYVRFRNFALHEFGHCLAAGHTGGESSGGTVCNLEQVCYSPPPGDVMALANGEVRLCLSNLNLQSLAEAYDHLPGPWEEHDGETYMQKSEYAQFCMPEVMERF